MANFSDDIITRLHEMYPNAKCELDYESGFQLLVAVILSAQCTDKRVNIVTKRLFEIAKTPNEIADMPSQQLEELIHSCGFYRVKAANIISCARDIVQLHGGEVPSTLEQLVKLAGVGRKTANVVLSVIFHQPTIAVDTHVFRVAHRLGMSDGATPELVEGDLMQSISSHLLPIVHHCMIFHGRYCCKATSPMCKDCSVKQWCKYI